MAKPTAFFLESVNLYMQQIVFGKIENFSKFYNNARKIRTTHFLLQYQVHLSQNNYTEIKLGIVASKKNISKRAVKRNRAKRRIRAAFMQIVKKHEFTTNNCHFIYEFVFIANKSILTAPFLDILPELETALQKIKIPVLDSKPNSV